MPLQAGMLIEQGSKVLYEIGEPIAAGGFGEVHHGKRLQPPKQRVALKVPSATVLADEIWRRKFKREARVLANISHPNVVKVLDFLELDDGDMVLVQEYVSEAQTLSQALEERSEEDGFIASLLLQALYALRAMHGRGSRPAVVHRDLSPRNILVDGRGLVRRCV